MNIFLHDLKSNTRSIVIWSMSLGIMAILFLSLFPSFTQDVAASQKILENLPLALREALGISLSNFFTIFGFFSYLFSFVAVAGAIQAMNLGVGVIAKEDSGKTADFLLTKPVSRSSVITQKLLTAVCILFITSVVFVVAAFVTARVVSTQSFEATPLLLIAGSLFLIQVAFLALGLLLSAVVSRIKSVISVSLPTIFGFFIIGSIGSIVGNDTVRYLTPFKFYDPLYLLQHHFYDPKFLLIEAVFVLVAVSSAYLLFNRKDIRSAS